MFKMLLLATAVLVTAAPARPAGSIVGHVTFRQGPLQKTANRYPTGSGGAARVIEPIPAVAYLVGAFPGGDKAATTAKPRMAQRDTAFQPGLLIVPVGSTVDFPNQDHFFHNVFSYSKPKRFDLGRYPRGETKSVRFDQPGGVSVFCEIHKWMRAGIVVVENPYHAMVDAEGNFRIDGVPPGKYKLEVWHIERGRRTVDITVPEAGSARVNIAF